MPLITASFFIVGRFGWNEKVWKKKMWLFHKLPCMKDFISQILNIRHMLASLFPAIACFDLGYPEYGRGSVFIPLPLWDGWWSFGLPSSSPCWTGGHNERWEQPFLAFKQILIMSQVLRLKFVSWACKYKLRIRAQRVLFEVWPTWNYSLLISV